MHRSKSENKNTETTSGVKATLTSLYLEVLKRWEGFWLVVTIEGGQESWNNWEEMLPELRRNQ